MVHVKTTGYYVTYFAGDFVESNQNIEYVTQSLQGEPGGIEF